MAAVKRVWILGAGFSVPLGGPLLADLFSETAELLVTTTFPQLATPEFRQIYQLYRHGEGRKVWRDAEQFLDLLDAALEHEAEARIMDQIVDSAARATEKTPNAEGLTTGARLLVAARCQCRIHGTELDGAARSEHESWLPYRNWIESLDGNDTILSFNYDTVVEDAARAVGADLRVVLPGRSSYERGEDRLIADSSASQRFAAETANCPALLKLHGSVSWVSSGAHISTSPFAAAVESRHHLAIATPGNSKSRTVGRLFGELWREAEGALGSARHVLFVGYRLPESDAEARHRLLRALDSTGRDGRSYRIVLGPDTSSAERLRRLLRTVADSGRRVVVEPYWAEDLLEEHALRRSRPD